MTDHADTQDKSSATKRIWYVFSILSIVTIIEVALGIVKPAFMIENTLIDLHYLNWTFIILTIVKAYYITWAFMHMEHETAGLRRSVVWTSVFLITYLIAILLIEGGYIQDVYSDSFIKWNL